jgi:hypothetical protein
MLNILSKEKLDRDGSFGAEKERLPYVAIPNILDLHQE